MLSISLWVHILFLACKIFPRICRLLQIPSETANSVLFMRMHMLFFHVLVVFFSSNVGADKQNIFFYLKLKELEKLICNPG